MKRGEIGRRGLSPLIATILLIAFAAALGTLVVSWALPTPEPQGACQGVRIEFEQLPQAQTVCYSDNSRELRFVIKNSGEQHVHLLRLRAITKDLEVTERDIPADLEPGRAGTYSLAYETTSPNDISVSLLPVLEQGRACPSAELQHASIPRC